MQKRGQISEARHKRWHSTGICSFKNKTKNPIVCGIRKLTSSLRRIGWRAQGILGGWKYVLFRFGVVVMQTYIVTKTQRTEHLRSVYVIICKLFFNVIICKLFFNKNQLLSVLKAQVWFSLHLCPPTNHCRATLKGWLRYLPWVTSLNVKEVVKTQSILA